MDNANLLESRSGVLADNDCAKEPIHIPGGIQPHGFLVSVDDFGVIVQHSENCVVLCPGRPISLLGLPLASLIGDALTQKVLSTTSPPDSSPRFIGTIPDPREGCLALGVSAHRCGAIMIVELEASASTADRQTVIYKTMEHFLTRLEEAQTIAQLGQLAAEQVRKIAGFGRSLVYRFDKDGHGHVFAESLAEGYTSYINHRFPASDIPSQARELYKKSRIRLIADVDYVASPLTPSAHPATDAPTDLSFASLRSVSAVHLHYMRNMQTAASMSMSIVVDNALWGLISCHNSAPSFPSFEARAACAQLAQILSLQIAERMSLAAERHRQDLRKILGRLVASMADAENVMASLVGNASDVLALTGATGAAFIFEESLETIGMTPSEAAIEHIVAWLDARKHDVYATDEIGTLFPRFAEMADCAGFLAISVSRIYRNYVIWFRPEIVRTVEWAGNPYAKAAKGAASPRPSFERWTDVVRGKAAQWQSTELDIAREFRTSLLSAILRGAETMAQLAVELTRANKELEGVSYAVSHDLRAPLRHIAGFADSMKHMGDTAMQTPRARHYIDRIIVAAQLGGKLVDDLLSFAQMGRSPFHPEKIDVHAEVSVMIKNALFEKDADRVVWHVGAMLPVEADAASVHVVLSNLLSNAVKFSAPRDIPRVDIGAYPGEGALAGQQVFYVQDNGVGFDMRDADKLFGVFQRLHPKAQFEGTGIGLANVHRIIERHGGRVWAQSKPGEGATFFFSLPLTFGAHTKTRSETAESAMARQAADAQLATTTARNNADKAR